MPLVISQTSGAVSYVSSVEVLAEILGHSNFDGEEWAIGDRLIFEDGSESRIKQEPGELFHTWNEPQLSDLDDLKQAINYPEVESWKELFEIFQTQTKRSGCLTVLLILVALFGLFTAGG